MMAFKEDHADIKQLFRVHWTIWKWLGQVPGKIYPLLYKLYAIVLHLFVSIAYTLHLTIGVYRSKSLEEIFRNIAITVTCAVCTIKFFTTWWNLEKVYHVESLFNKLNGRISHADEWTYYRKHIVSSVKFVLHLFYFLCLGTAITSESSVLINGVLDEWRLMYPAYFPFDPYATTLNYAVAHLYQFFGASVIIAENLINDTYGVMCLALLAGHARLLGMRVSRIGYDSTTTLEENNQILLECIQDHRLIFDCHYAIGEIINWGLFSQLVCASIAMGCSIIYVIFYVDNVFSMIYFAVYCLAMTMEVYPFCYYGTNFEIEFEKMTYFLFSCNWMDQSREFKQNLRIFIEQSLKKRDVMVGGMFQINLDTFFATCKGAYSLFTLAMGMKK